MKGLFGAPPHQGQSRPSARSTAFCPPPIKPVLRLLQLITIFIYEATWRFSVLFEGES